MRKSRATGLALACGLLVAIAVTYFALVDSQPEALNAQIGELYSAGKYAEAIPLAERYAGAIKARRGSAHPDYAIAINNLAQLLKANNRLAAAEPLMRRTISIFEKVESDTNHVHPNYAASLNNLALLLEDTNRLTEAEPLLRRALDIDEKSLGFSHPDVARDLNNLAQLLQDTNRFVEAEPLLRRALAIDEKSHGPEDPTIATRLNNLAAVLQATNRLVEAEPLLRRALAIDVKGYGPEHPTVAIRLNNLAGLLQATNRPTDAELLYRRALMIDEKSLGPEHSYVAIDLNNLARLLQATNRQTEAEPLLRRALAMDEKNFGPEHPAVAVDLNNLAVLRAELGDWADAAALAHRAKPALIAGTNDGRDASGLAKAVLARNTWALRAHARATFRADPTSAAANAESFELAQWALQTGASDALSQMSARFAKGTGPLAALVRERQDLSARRREETRRLDVAAGQADAKTAQEARTAIGSIDIKLAAVNARLATEFKDFAELATPQPVTVAATQALLRDDEALVVFLDVPQFGKLAEECLIWIVTKTELRRVRSELGTEQLAERVHRLRAGLDRAAATGSAAERTGVGRSFAAVGDSAGVRDFLPFDLTVAHELYVSLFGQVDDLIRGKHLLIVLSGPLTSIPLHVLVTEKPDKGVPHSVEGYRAAAWLAMRNAITILPSVGSLQALRQLPPSHSREPYIGFGNPLLLGPRGVDKSAWGKQRCGQPIARRMAQAQGIARRSASLRAMDLAELRAQEPLPETADELCAVAAALGALGQQEETVWLGERATERNLKALSRNGKLAHYKVLHFATHGLLASESEAILKAKAEPALILTPPKDGTPASELEDDDGLLTASEVAQLDLDADWVVLSACNTAAGDKGDAEALSGLARAFFYAKARALLVSHWPVNSDAAVKLTTKAFVELGAHSQIGRAEALRRSMAELITKGAPHEAHPAFWAPFVLVGEGAR